MIRCPVVLAAHCVSVAGVPVPNIIGTGGILMRPIAGIAGMVSNRNGATLMMTTLMMPPPIGIWIWVIRRATSTVCTTIGALAQTALAGPAPVVIVDAG
jgi:hypothetical protein